jgi:CheY-like chemotaxis protein
MKILYADDDSDDREFFAKILVEIDPHIQLLEASDGIETLNILATDVIPDYIFLDINMPRLNGDETLAAIRKDPKLNDTKVVMYSTTIRIESIPGYEELQASFLKKPYTIQDGITAVRTVINNHHISAPF